MRRVRRSRIAAGTTLGALAVLLASGCSSGDPVVESEELERQVTSALTEQVGQAPDDVSCPDELPAEVGESVRCELTAGGTTIGVTVTASAVDGSDAELDIQVDDAPSG
ncbi:DUF4333 domain-containing protein [Streptomyces sp. DSM 44915]|uniref:DUF4333 domain-containing protein n=1 Tax=Streptomyces chisholmiae TaxID=3075540 RepID=A0ABU2JYH4_9ACTN|nr:DUF4333 domain-containing protein [Streptomyces sp. DSM 44915]MDT0270060.1 DUF4333 domain-containing protein [Streptomyces sp. DSM 44915]